MVKAQFKMKRFLSMDTSLSVLLIALLLLVFVFYPLGEINFVRGAVLEVVFSIMLISGVMSLSSRKSAPFLVCAIAFAAMFSGWFGLVYPSRAVFIAKSSLTILFLSALIIIVLVEVFRDGEITFQRIQGAIAAYLLIGVVWAMFYRIIDLLRPNAFMRGPGAILGPASNILTREYVFFSFGSLTTVGYTGLIAIHPVSLSLVMMEALIGQLFPAILLARLVSMEVSRKK
jgi:hypothetical protein